MKRKKVRKRLMTCLGCKHLKFKKSLFWKQCSKCNCFIEFKIRYADATCPKGKW